MKNKLKIAVLALLAFFVAPLVHAQQYTLGQTTLGATITAGQTQIPLASVTGVNGYGPNLQPIISSSTSPQSHLFIDREEIQVLSVNTVSKIVQVTRGVNGTRGAAHRSGQMVLSGPAIAFYTYDPGGTPGSVGGSTGGDNCTTANVLVTPWLNVRTGAQWLCSTITSTWVPGFGNAANPGSSVVTTAVASATTIVPTGTLFHLTGTTPVTTITTPLGCNATAVGGCQFVVIADTGTSSMFGTGGNLLIGAAITTLTGNEYVFVWDATNSKWAVR